MPWNEVSPMDERIRFVAEVRTGALSVAELCRRYGISRKTGYKWLKRANEVGICGLRELSRAPRSCPHKTPIEMREALVALRKTHPTWGARKIAGVLRNVYGLRSPAPSTIAAIFKAEGLSKPRRRRNGYVRSWPEKLTVPDRNNHVWTVDYKGWFRFLDGQPCWPLTIMDLHSRYMLGCEALPRPAFAPTWSAFDRLFCRYGLPEVIRVDNGKPFAGHGAGGLSRLSAIWLRLGVDVEFIERGKPQQNGSHERMHRSLKNEFRKAGDLRRQQRRFRMWRRAYNHHREHEALNKAVPASIYEKSPRRHPSEIPDFFYDPSYVVRRVKPSGEIKWRGSRRYINQGLGGCSVGLLENRAGNMNVYAGNVFLGVLTPSGSRGLIGPLEPEDEN